VEQHFSVHLLQLFVGLRKRVLGSLEVLKHAAGLPFAENPTRRHVLLPTVEVFQVRLVVLGLSQVLLRVVLHCFGQVGEVLKG
jgi:hypothetical protein